MSLSPARQRPEIDRVDYPGLADHPQHELARRQFAAGEDGQTLFGTIVSFRLRGGRPAADAFIHEASRIPFCPSLGELSTTLSHPETTSHRGMSAEAREALGIRGGTIRLVPDTIRNLKVTTADDLELAECLAEAQP